MVILDIVPLPHRYPDTKVVVDSTMLGFTMIKNSDISMEYGRKVVVEKVFKYKIIALLPEYYKGGTTFKNEMAEYIVISHKPLFKNRRLDLLDKKVSIIPMAVRYYTKGHGYTRGYLFKENICEFLGITNDVQTSTYSEYVLTELNRFSIGQGTLIEDIIKEEIENAWTMSEQKITNLSDLSNMASTITPNELRSILNYIVEDITCMNIPSNVLRNQLSSAMDYLIPDIPENDYITNEFLENTMLSYSGHHWDTEVNLFPYLTHRSVANINFGLFRSIYDQDDTPFVIDNSVKFSEENTIIRDYLLKIITFINDLPFTSLDIEYNYPDYLEFKNIGSIYRDRKSVV